MIPRKIRSFVRRESRLTPSQAHAFEVLWQCYGIDYTNEQVSGSWQALFSQTAPLVLEIGFGDGRSLLPQVRDNPQLNFIGVEVYRTGVGQFLKQVHQEKLKNVRVFNHDAVEVLSHCLPANALSVVQIYFPDPWPKKRHHKRRLIQPAFVEQLLKVLQCDGLLRIATDWQPYAEHIETVLAAYPQFERGQPSNFPILKNLNRCCTKFEEKGHAAERVIHEFCWVKRA